MVTSRSAAEAEETEKEAEDAPAERTPAAEGGGDAPAPEGQINDI